MSFTVFVFAVLISFISVSKYVFIFSESLISVSKYMFIFSELSLLNKTECQLYLASVAGFSTRSV